MERIVDTVKATVERMEATLMHMAQSLNSQVPRQPEPQRSQPAKLEGRIFSYANGEAHRRPEHSPQGSTSTGTKRNEATSGQCAPPSQRTGENPMDARMQQTSKNSRVVRMQQTSENLMVEGTQ